ncbi:MAG: FAD-dependent monooxygenase [Ignavibacteriae bacterium]|nr:FAD-dependent monooxygenase [Ignavibacteriota bacterium]MCB9244692.1 FAD-dependent monooxygenase [Ignavibacteriales bacterium]
MLETKKITIIGAGLAGSLLSIYLANRGYIVDVYERRADMRKHDIGGGKSINLALSVRGIHALKEVGLFEEIKKIAIPMYGRMVHPLDGEINLQPYGKDESEYINSISRAELNKLMMNMTEPDPNVTYYFNERCTGMNLESGEVHFVNDETHKEWTLRSDLVIATDGATSPIRMEMLKVPRFDFSQEYENYGYKELNIPPAEGGGFRMFKNALHIWPRGSYMLIALPNIDGSYTVTLFLAYDEALGGENSFEYLNSDERVVAFFEKNFPDAIELMPDLVEDFNSNPTGTLMTVKCFPWGYKDHVTMLGDSCHAIVPFFGQGMNAAFEDCVYLNEIIGKHEGDWGRIFREYEVIRKPNTDAIADLARENFIEMRDLVDDDRFLLKKKIEKELYKKHPERFIPKYSMVSFMRIPYSTALERGKIQEGILNELSEGMPNMEDVNWEKAEDLVTKQLNKM